MKLLIVSDSHDNLEAVERLLASLKGEEFDALIHAGDIVSPFTLKMFAGHKFYGVFGNNDGERLALSRVAADNGMVLVEQPLFIELNGYRIAVLHGVRGAEDTHRLVNSLARSGDYDLVVYGHLHQVDVREVGDTLVVNPGTLAGYLADRRTYAVVDMEKRVAEVAEV